MGCGETTSTNSSVSTYDPRRYCHTSTDSLDFTTPVALASQVFAISVLIVLCVIGNALMIFAVLATRKDFMLRASSLLLINLGVADILVGSLVLPMWIASTATLSWPFPEVVCSLTAFCTVTLMVCSILSLCTIAVDRYLILAYPLRYPAEMTTMRSAAVITSVWTFCFLVAGLPLVGWGEYRFQPQTVPICNPKWTQEVGFAIFLMVVGLTLPLAAMTGSYAKIVQIAKHHLSQIETTQGHLVSGVSLVLENVSDEVHDEVVGVASRTTVAVAGSNNFLQTQDGGVSSGVPTAIVSGSGDSAGCTVHVKSFSGKREGNKRNYGPKFSFGKSKSGNTDYGLTSFSSNSETEKCDCSLKYFSGKCEIETKNSGLISYTGKSDIGHTNYGVKSITVKSETENKYNGLKSERKNKTYDPKSFTGKKEMENKIHGPGIIIESVTSGNKSQSLVDINGNRSSYQMRTTNSNAQAEFQSNARNKHYGKSESGSTMHSQTNFEQQTDMIWSVTSRPAIQPLGNSCNRSAGLPKTQFPMLKGKASKTGDGCRSSKSASKVSFSKTMRTVNRVFIAVGAFFLCWGPYVILNFWSVNNDDSPVPYCADLVTTLLAFANSCVNPVIFILLNKNFRHRVRMLGRKGTLYFLCQRQTTQLSDET